MASTESPAASGWLGELRAELAALEGRSLRRTILTPRHGQGETLSIDGRELLNLTSNNYLGLAGDPRVVEAAVEAARAYGASVSASRLLCGSTPLHEELEGRLAALKGQEAALLYSSGYLANLGVLTALARPGDAIVFTEALTHGTLPWTADTRRSTLFYKFSPHGTSWSGAYLDPDDFRGYDDMDDRKMAILEPPNSRYPGRPTRPEPLTA